MKNSILSIVIFLFYTFSVSAQEYSYTHYDSKDGLAGNQVYCMTQDKEGFLWIATETGISRFDGTHFKNFTREDGLPDNDVIQLFTDSKGRVWMAPFRKTVCYYYEGKIHNNKNDSLIKKLRIQDNIYRFAEDREGNILMQEKFRLHLVKTNGEVATINSNGDKPLGYVSLIARRKDGGFWVLDKNNIYVFNNNRFTFWKSIVFLYIHFNFVTFVNETLMWWPRFKEIAFLSMRTGKTLEYPFTHDSDYVNLALPGNEHAAFCTNNGVYVCSIDNPINTQHYLPGRSVSNMFEDSEGNWWFCTLGKGIYRLNSAAVINLTFKKSSKLRYLSSEDEQMNNILDVIKKNAAAKGAWKELSDFTWHNTSPLFVFLYYRDNRFLLGTRSYLAKLALAKAELLNKIDTITVKALWLHKNILLMATEKEVVSIDPETFKVLDTIWHERATCLFPNNDTIYIGATNGLYQLSLGNRVQYLGEKEPLLQGRVTAVREDADHNIWVATAGDGLIVWKNGKLIKQITVRDGLTSNNCRCLFWENGKLWIGTDKGLNKINVSMPRFPIEKYTISDGLASDIIDAIYIHDKKVFIGSSEGITFFDEDKMSSRSRCDLRFTDITIAGETFYPADAPVSIPHKKNNLQFNYVGISFKSGGDVRYRYRLLGLDSTWRETRETFLSYPILPSGEYQLQLQAINKFDVSSKIVTTAFVIEKLLYEKNWFRTLIGLLFLSTTGLLVWLIVRRVKRRERQKTDFIKRISELEQLSRKAQMNPHFIFNSLNSIQQYVMDADVVGANKFISGFSRLIRQTLDFSSKSEISLEEELDYLSNYLELEKNRLEDAFTWSVVCDKDVEPSEYHIPPMILQPFVENSVRHGLRFRKDREGKVTIQIKKENDYLVCMIEDNGIGRKAAMKHKSVSPINYQSKGLSLTADRITMFNKEHSQKITMHFDDLEDEAQHALGTRVTVCFPVN